MRKTFEQSNSTLQNTFEQSNSTLQNTAEIPCSYLR
jgi:hypothetical protein